MILNEKKLQVSSKESVENFDSREQKIMENKGLVGYIAKRYVGNSVEFQELFNVGMVGLIKAVDTFSDEKGVLFATYAAKCIENEILMFLKKCQKWNQYISIYASCFEKKRGKEMFFVDIFSCLEEDIFSRFELQCTYGEVRYALNQLPDRNKNMVLLSFGFIDNRCYTQEEIAKIFGVSQSFVSRVIRTSLKQLKEELLQLEKKDLSTQKFRRVRKLYGEKRSSVSKG